MRQSISDPVVGLHVWLARLSGPKRATVGFRTYVYARQYIRQATWFLGERVWRARQVVTLV